MSWILSPTDTWKCNDVQNHEKQDIYIIYQALLPLLTERNFGHGSFPLVSAVPGALPSHKSPRGRKTDRCLDHGWRKRSKRSWNRSNPSVISINGRLKEFLDYEWQQWWQYIYNDILICMTSIKIIIIIIIIIMINMITIITILYIYIVLIIFEKQY